MSEIALERGDSKEYVFDAVAEYLGDMSLRHTAIDIKRPWGGFYVIDELQIADFVDGYFPNERSANIEQKGRLSPKILIVEPGKRLSWQLHNRRTELWKILNGPVGVVTSPDDTLKPLDEVEPGNTVRLGAQTRHRLIGLNNWGVIAEIWRHTDPDNPSNEDDIIRIEDDFGR